ncbi:hypothetical protein VPH35_082789 [Triticum aestivum]
MVKPLAKHHLCISQTLPIHYPDANRMNLVRWRDLDARSMRATTGSAPAHAATGGAPRRCACTGPPGPLLRLLPRLPGRSRTDHVRPSTRGRLLSPVPLGPASGRSAPGWLTACGLRLPCAWPPPPRAGPSLLLTAAPPPLWSTSALMRFGSARSRAAPMALLHRLCSVHPMHASLGSPPRLQQARARGSASSRLAAPACSALAGSAFAPCRVWLAVATGSGSAQLLL